MAIESCLLSWGIKRVFTVTVDNASSNDVAISFLKRKINAWRFSILSCKYLHMRCIAHIINLVVIDGMKDGLTPIKKVRDAVRYIRQSPTRLQRYATVDPYFKIDLQSCEGNGVADSLEWEYIGKNVEFLGHFYELTLRISGSRYIISNIFFDEISSVDCLLQEWKSMVVDPRYQLEFMHFALLTVYGKEKGTELAKKVKFESIEEGTKKKPRMRLGHQFMQHKIEIGEAKSKSDLDSYLNEDILVLDEKEDFDKLKWWKMNANRFLILSHMVKDILAVPISTVVSESTFSTGCRVLDCFRSSLTPKIVEALICT
ncbi:zinc finger BED domain-containing protein RICESLEEPER 2-like [Manihot esculenta]|uniref:zinc finger BED domain-containing protein RICESLEEPER 2-like n=1 Tax=Manihot esculenta TaxID=3983 RepID=UPI000B5D0E7C|nr:zinc finger BED domain-containing protein RICESLEEPER 2-like [Manihot esculenta]